MKLEISQYTKVEEEKKQPDKPKIVKQGNYNDILKNNLSKQAQKNAI
jgi:hypothetical protein